MLETNFNKLNFYNNNCKSIFFYNIFYNILFTKFIFNKYFIKTKKKIYFFYNFLNFKRNDNFKYKIYINKSLFFYLKIFLFFFNFYFLNILINFKNFYKFYLFLITQGKKKLNTFIFKKKLLISQNIFNSVLFNYYYTNLYSLVFLNNLYILNIFNLNFFLDKDEVSDKNINVYNSLYPVFNKKNNFFESKFINKYIFSFDKFFNLFILNFYEKLFKSFFFVKLNFNLNLKNYYKNYYKNYPFPISNTQQDYYTIDEMFEIFCFSFIKKDINVLND